MSAPTTHSGGTLHHPFCPLHACSRGDAPDGRATVASDVRCLDGVALTLRRVDGRSRWAIWRARSARCYG